LLKSGRPYDRAQAAELLAEAAPDRTAEAAATLRALLTDTQGRAMAIPALARMAPAHAVAAVPPLRGMLKDSKTRNQGLAIRTLGEIGPAARDAIPDLAELLAPPIGSQVAATLGRLGPDAVPALVKALDSNDFLTQQAAAKSLSHAGPEAR